MLQDRKSVSVTRLTINLNKTKRMRLTSETLEDEVKLGYETIEVAETLCLRQAIILEENMIDIDKKGRISQRSDDWGK